MVMAGRPPHFATARQAHQVVPAAAVVLIYTVVMAGGTLTIPLYVLWASKFGFGPVTTTLVFVTYVIAVVGTLLVAGSLSDAIGRRPVLALAPPGASRARSFLAGGVLVAASSGVNGFFSSPAPAFLRDDLGISNLAVIGVGVGALFVSALPAQVIAPPAILRRSTGTALPAIGMIVIEARSGSAPLLSSWSAPSSPGQLSGFCSDMAWASQTRCAIPATGLSSARRISCSSIPGSSSPSCYWASSIKPSGPGCRAPRRPLSSSVPRSRA
ncbi:hypothetical protein [Microbispora sp. NPDC046933]|uniref:hypothetical protein n=1 Tax=Microbispora sp. NPDC046933 TaxID=3155618 RepID=UPI0033F409DA